jgi:hypothetical protein
MKRNKSDCRDFRYYEGGNGYGLLSAGFRSAWYFEKSNLQKGTVGCVLEIGLLIKELHLGLFGTLKSPM